LILFFTLTVIFGVYITYAPSAFAYRCWDSRSPGKVICCGESHGTTYCTECSNTNPPSHCSPRFPTRTVGETAPPTDVAPPKVCPDGSSPDANGVCPPVAQGSTSSLPSNTTTPKGATGVIEQPPADLASQPKTSQRAFSPTGGCVPGGTTCIPCDPGLATHGANCIPSGDWRPRSSGLGTELGKVCPDGSSPDANGKCPPTTQAPTDQGTTLPPTNDNNNPKHKGSNPGQLGGSLLNNNNNPSSQTTDNTSPKHHKDGKNALQVPPTDQGPS
jgi:hypothetical protein